MLPYIYIAYMDPMGIIKYPLVMTHIAMERSTMLLLIGKPSISMGHLYHGYVKKPEGIYLKKVQI